MVLWRYECPDWPTWQNFLVNQISNRQRWSFKVWKVISKNLLNFFFFVSHGLLSCFPKISLFHDEWDKEWKPCFVKLFANKSLEILLLLDKGFLISNNLNSISLFSWSFLVASSQTVVSSLHGQQKLLHPTSRPVPNVKVAGCFFRNYLQNGFCLATSHYFSQILWFLFPPNSLLLAQPQFEIVHHWVAILAMNW